MSTEYASVTELLEDEVTGGETAEVELPNGKKVIVRGMSRFELSESQKDTDDPMVIEARMMAACIVKPEMSFAQVTQMQKAKKPLFLKQVVFTIRELSGLTEGADKSAVAEV